MFSGARPRILVVGSANADLVATVPRIPKPGESLIGSSFRIVPGGKGANQAVAAARLGAETYFAGCVGSDAFGGMQRETLARDGINLDYLKRHPSEPTGTAVILVSETGQNSIVVVPAANLGIHPEDIVRLEPIMSSFDAVLLQLEIPLDTVETTLDLARRNSVLSILDAGPAQQVPDALIRLADIVSPNETEAEALTGVAVANVDDARRAAAQLLGRGAQTAVMKLGASGALYAGETFIHVPAFSIAPVDTTAAGDAFTAALACAWKRLAPREALRFANAAGALAAMTAGAQPSMPSFEKVEAFMRERGSSAR